VNIHVLPLEHRLSNRGACLPGAGLLVLWGERELFIGGTYLF